MFIAPSVSPLYSNNPAYTVMDMTGQRFIYDLMPTFFNISVTIRYFQLGEYLMFQT